VDGDKALVSFISPMESVFPTVHGGKGKVEKVSCHERITHKPKITTLKPRVFIPVFPGTNCEYDTARAFEKAGAEVDTLVFRNLTPKDVNESVKAFAESIKKAQIIALPGGFSAGDEPEGSGKFIASVLRNPEIAEAVMTLLKQRDGLMLGICNGFQALVKLGLLPYGEIRSLQEDAPTLTFNKIGRHVARMANVRVSSVHSPWMADANVGEVYQTAFSHGEGRFFASDELVRQLIKKGQIATQYVDDEGNPTYDGHFNLNGSVEAIEGIFSEDGRIFGKMGHVERMGNGLYKNIYGEKEFDIFKSGVKYFK
jgi:phosphoribosylformylglycinamidine synthase (EC 6.3.5.3)